MEKYQLNPEATEELKEIFQTSVKKVKAELEAPGPRCRWDQIHEMIKSHSPGTHTHARALQPFSHTSRLSSFGSHTAPYYYLFSRQCIPPGTSLVIVNLPDPPDLPHEEEQVSEEDQMNEMLEYTQLAPPSLLSLRLLPPSLFPHHHPLLLPCLAGT